MEPIKGAWLSGGYICERVLDEKDGTQSLIRIIDTINVAIDPEDIVITDGEKMVLGDQVSRWSFSYVLTLTQEPPEQKSHVEITQITTKGERVPITDEVLEVPGPGRRINIMAVIDLGLRNEGETWIEARLNGQIVLMTPLRVRFVVPESAHMNLPTDASSQADSNEKSSE